MKLLTKKEGRQLINAISAIMSSHKETFSLDLWEQQWEPPVNSPVKIMPDEKLHLLVAAYIEHLKTQTLNFTIVYLNKKEGPECSTCSVYTKSNQFQPAELHLEKVTKLFYNSVEDYDFHILFDTQDDYLLAKVTNLYGLLK